jgi:hypothetical protein
LQLLCSPLLKDVTFFNVYLTMGEVNELLALVQRWRILYKVTKFWWYNEFEAKELKPWMADKVNIELLKNSIEVAFPHLNLQFDQRVSK